MTVSLLHINSLPRHRLWSASSAFQQAQNAATQSTTIRRVVIDFLLTYAPTFSASAYGDEVCSSIRFAL